MAGFKLPFNLIIAGVGGQGNVLISQLIARVFIRKGFVAVVGETYGVSQRGGSVMSHVRISKERVSAPIIPEGHGNFILGMEPMESLRILRDFGNPDIFTLTNTRPVDPIDVISGSLAYPDVQAIIHAIETLSSRAWFIHASDLALEIGNSLFTNMVMVGALIGIGQLPLTEQDFVDILHQYMSDKTFEDNLAAIRKGIAAIEINES
jgi:indolepyruvate ferredoxin oxidoreductase beta subunit